MLDVLTVIFEERESVSDDFGGLEVMAAVDLTLDSLFGAGVEGQIHGRSIRLFGRRLRKLAELD
jgi:hypothetical protein